MSEIQKCPNLVRRGGSTFFKNVWNSKMSQMSEGGEGSTLIGTLSQIFSFFLVTPPLMITMQGFKYWSMQTYIRVNEFFFLICMRFFTSWTWAVCSCMILFWGKSWSYNSLGQSCLPPWISATCLNQSRFNPVLNSQRVHLCTSSPKKKYDSSSRFKDQNKN